MPFPKSGQQRAENDEQYGDHLLTREEAAALIAALSDEKLLTREQAAAFLGVSERTVDGWCANVRTRQRRPRARGGDESETAVRRSAERLPYLKLGHRVFFQLGDLRRFRDERKVAA